MATRFLTIRKPILNRYFVPVVAALFRMSLSLSMLSAPALAGAEQLKRDSNTLLNLEQAVINAVEHHPSLLAFKSRIQREDGNIVQARTGSRKTLNLDIENALGSGDFSGVDEAQTTLSVAWILEKNLLNARESHARANKSLVTLEKDIKRLDIASETATRFFTALMFQEKSVIAEQWQQDAQAMYRHITQRVAAGKSPVADQHLAKAQWSLSQLEREDIHHEIETAHVQLSALWGVSTPAFDWLQGSSRKTGQLPEYSELKMRLSNNPDLAFYLTQERIAQSAIHLAKTETKNRWSFNTGVRHYAATDDVAFVAGFSVPLGAEKRNRGKISALQASISTYQYEAKAQQVQLEADLFEFYQAFRHAQHAINILSQDTIPAIEKALAETRKSYDLGRSGFQDWTRIQKELLDSRINLLEACYLAHINRIEIERLTGSSANSLTQTAETVNRHSFQTTSERRNTAVVQ